MIESNEKIQTLIERSRDVLREATLGNGAIIRAHLDPSFDPKIVSAYRTVWPRIGAFAALALQRLNLPGAEKFYHWLLDRPEGFANEHLLFGNYTTAGKIGDTGRSFQPDQAGTILWSIAKFVHNDHERALPYRELIQRLAQGLIESWDKSSFIPDTIDIWGDELRRTSVKEETNFTYTLAACSAGLKRAHLLFPNKQWKKASEQMEKRALESYDKARGIFLRVDGNADDQTVDASLLGLLWPFEILSSDDARLQATISMIERQVAVNGGMRRFEHDHQSMRGAATETGGAWPVLNFWMAIVLKRLGEAERAEHYLAWVLDRVTTTIPEQLFTDFRKPIAPSTWSHAMFILACSELGVPIHV